MSNFKVKGSNRTKNQNKTQFKTFLCEKYKTLQNLWYSNIGTNKLRRKMGAPRSMYGRQTTFMQCSVERDKLKENNYKGRWEDNIQIGRELMKWDAFACWRTRFSSGLF